MRWKWGDDEGRWDDFCFRFFPRVCVSYRFFLEGLPIGFAWVFWDFPSVFLIFLGLF